MHFGKAVCKRQYIIKSNYCIYLCDTDLHRKIREKKHPGSAFRKQLIKYIGQNVNFPLFFLGV